MRFLSKIVKVYLLLLFAVIGFTVNYRFENFNAASTPLAQNQIPTDTPEAITPEPTPVFTRPIQRVQNIRRLPAKSLKPSGTASKTISSSAVTKTITGKPASSQQGSNPPGPKNTPVPTPDNRCIITIDGGRYDVTQFRFIHSGGNVFNCGADMSQTFWNRHGQSEFNILQRYRI